MTFSPWYFHPGKLFSAVSFFSGKEFCSNYCFTLNSKMEKLLPYSSFGNHFRFFPLRFCTAVFCATILCNCSSHPTLRRMGRPPRPALAAPLSGSGPVPAMGTAALRNIPSTNNNILLKSDFLLHPFSSPSDVIPPPCCHPPSLSPGSLSNCFTKHWKSFGGGSARRRRGVYRTSSPLPRFGP